MASYIKFPDRKPPPPAEKPKRRLSRQRRKRLDRDAEYNAMRDIYLEENPECANCGSFTASQVHHVVRGTAGRARSLLNSETWLPCCSVECHEELERLPVADQIERKLKYVCRTIERLRK